MNYFAVQSNTFYNPLLRSPWDATPNTVWTSNPANPWTYSVPPSSQRFNRSNTPSYQGVYFPPGIGYQNPAQSKNKPNTTETLLAGWGDSRLAHVFNRPAPPPLRRPVQPIAPPAPRKIVAANEHASYWGDPHVADADRAEKGNNRHSNFIVKGDGIFQLLKDRDVFLNGVHKKYPQWDYEVTDRIGLRVAGLSIEMGAYDGTPKLNGASFKGEKILPNGTKISFDGTKLSVNTGASGEYDFEISIVNAEHKNPDGSPIKYLDTDIRTKSKGVGADGIMPTGILGEGFDADNQARTQLNHDLNTYKRGGLFHP